MKGDIMSDSKKPKSWRERKQSIKHKWQVPLIFSIEWPCEWISYWLEQWAFLDILKRLGHLAIVVAVIFYIKGCPERQMQSENLQMQVENLRQQLANQQKTKQYQAWQVINSAYGKPGGGGRKDALEDLHKDNVPLRGVDVSNAFLPELNLENADLEEANLVKAFLEDANFSGAFLDDANLAGACLYYSNLSGAYLSDANLAGADLERANLTGAKLDRANLSGATLMKANLKDIEGWRGIKTIQHANIWGVENPPDEFIKWATEQGAVEFKETKWIEYKEKIKQEKPKEKQ